MKPTLTIERHEPNGRRTIVYTMAQEGEKTRRPYTRHFDEFILNGNVERRKNGKTLMP